ncbi:hypothetical protein K7432_006766 [Basidiobolus ranarum]|uniref:Uncharacterized protein n=1 Tax=Basidiobolus ranarum TaxID=34480 RepID=A0ABR2WUD6_9FUNG
MSPSTPKRVRIPKFSKSRYYLKLTKGLLLAEEYIWTETRIGDITKQRHTNADIGLDDGGGYDNQESQCTNIKIGADHRKNGQDNKCEIQWKLYMNSQWARKNSNVHHNGTFCQHD